MAGMSPIVLVMLPPEFCQARRLPKRLPEQKACPRNEALHRLKKNVAGQVAVSVRIYEVVEHFAIIDPL
jgi:hypothetical protein